ncbi:MULTISPECIES: phosphate ABC transporter substrate-binding protein [Salinivibrio]|uniref:Phosphate-binding protein n=1 Tax=Salinivibrio proteolyticus TaxID=334715 RepID=A0ABY7L8Y1_9GAMM|nr:MULTISPECIES: phosphate ABC transporter substrate-binding protein [Salinivibrio]ODQ01182.1 phosphate ABC transporter substrate-binding protein [Salinivibrio sp. DV]OOF28338.1 phosphate ABC transporter substrate-binding protein [Salinivibrio sp. IB872]PCE67396.1 phosphate ABC transporter substrate-binding protein [Salinivibrio sp. YCSC6]QCF35703.1 phosphate ABC transporter substrate-binding protein [Salinivibrio sp. YCSC6]WBA13715.1 phosphate ABC transporter substrate-binding protein [Salini
MKSKVFGAIVMAGAMFSASASAQETVSISGSTSVTEVMEVLAETYHQQHQDTYIEVQGTGSSAGIKAAKNGTSYFGMASRELKASEKESSLKETVIARDGIAVVVNNANGVKNLTADQIAKIYRGEITNWSNVGGENKPIVLVTRDTASGTRGAFESIMGLKRKVNGMKVSAISQKAQVANGNGVVKTIVANNPLAIGYISLGSVDDSLKALSVDGHAPTTEAVAAGDYKVARPFLVLHKEGTTSAAADDFLNWVLSADGQKIVANQGYIAVK